MVISNGKLVSGHILLKQDSSSTQNLYDDAGNVISRTLIDSNGHTLTQASYYDERNELVAADYARDVTAGNAYRGVEEKRVYNAAGKLQAIEHFYEAGAMSRINGGLLKLDPYSEEAWTDGNPIGGMLASATIDHYDADGRLLQEQNFAHSGTWDGTGGTSTPPALPGVDATTWAGMSLQNQVTYRESDGSSGYDAVGNVTDYSYKNSAGRVDTYHVDYLRKDGYLEKATTGHSSDTNFRPATDTSYYNVFGDRIAIEQHVQLSSGTLDDEIRAFVYDANGEILRRRDGTLTSGAFVAKNGAGTTHYAYVNGQQVGSVDEGGGIDVVDGLTAFSNAENGTSGYVVQESDTLRSIAQAEYGDASLWYVIAQANALDSDEDLVAGQTLNVPQVTTNSNGPATFKPYNPAEISGSTTPPMVYAPPPPKPHCQTLSKIIAIAVTIIVGYYSGNPAAGAAAGNLAGQYSSMMFNNQFDWSRAARFAVNPFAGNANDFARTIYDPPGNGAPGKADYKSAAIAAAAAEAGSFAGDAIAGAGTWQSAAISAGVGYTVNVELSKAAGYNTSFSLREMGTSMAVAYAGYEISQGLGLGPVESRDPTNGAVVRTPQPFSWGLLVRQVTADVLTEGANYVIRKVAGLSAHWDWQEVGADAFGNAIGNSAVEKIGAYRKEHARVEALRKYIEFKGGFFNAFPASGADQSGWPAADSDLPPIQASSYMPGKIVLSSDDLRLKINLAPEDIELVPAELVSSREVGENFNPVDQAPSADWRMVLNSREDYFLHNDRSVYNGHQNQSELQIPELLKVPDQGLTLRSPMYVLKDPYWNPLDVHVDSGLGDTVDSLIAQSRTLSEQITYLRNNGWNIKWGMASEASNTVIESKEMSVSGRYRGPDGRDAVSQLSHEVGHALSQPLLTGWFTPLEKGMTLGEALDYAEKNTQVEMLGEGYATLNNISVEREIYSQAGVDIRIPSINASVNVPKYTEAYLWYSNGGSEIEAAQRIGDIYRENEIPGFDQSIPHGSPFSVNGNYGRYYFNSFLNAAYENM